MAIWQALCNLFGGSTFPSTEQGVVVPWEGYTISLEVNPHRRLFQELDDFISAHGLADRFSGPDAVKRAIETDQIFILRIYRGFKGDQCFAAASKDELSEMLKLAYPKRNRRYARLDLPTFPFDSLDICCDEWPRGKIQFFEQGWRSIPKAKSHQLGFVD